MTYTVAVRTLCEFTAKTGDLDLRFTPSATALEGMAGHALAAARRGAHYESEVRLEGGHAGVRVRGRADGFDPQAQRLDEVKTYRGALSALPANRRALHWAQARVYGALLCAERGLAQLDVALVYLDVVSQQEEVLVERCAASELQAFFEAQCERFAAWAAQEARHRLARDAWLAGLRFPHDTFRPGQRRLAQAVWRAVEAGRTLLAQAPTGIGKTIGTLFPMLRAMPPHGLDKLFCLSAKTPGRALVLEGLATITASAGEPRPPLRVLELVARDKACEHPDRACHGASCPLARGFYDRLPAARQAVVAAGGGDHAAVRRVALDHGLCPYYLTQELIRWSDVVVGDFNYYFDAVGLLHGLAQAGGWRVAVLADEAHNLVPRAREMYSATLSLAALAAARRQAPAPLRPAFRRLARVCHAIADRQTEAYAAYEDLPPGLLTALQALNTAVGDHQADAVDELPPDLLAFYFDSLHFARLAESFGPHSLFDVSQSGADLRDLTLCLRNLVPAAFLRPRFQTAHASVLFSATLTPWRYHADLLGLPDDLARVEVESPFDPSRLRVQVTPLSTRFADRPASRVPIVDLMARQFEAAPGNYLAFFPSFDYLEQVAADFGARHPGVPLWIQSRRMPEAERAAFLDRFRAGGRGIGFAVLGGAFGEAVDLPGERLIGAFIATLGLPQVNPVNEQMKARLQALFGEGQAYAYLYPGLQKVVQAAGRVIRGPADEGVVHLIDDRFTRAEVRRLLPAWWRVSRAARPSV